jgi:ABC-type oligopeptide transport system ATPase subunit
MRVRGRRRSWIALILGMDEGQIVEEGEPRRIFQRPQHPRTRQLLAQVR